MSGDAVEPVGQYCTFWLAGLLFGVPVEDVQEVLRHQDVTVVRRAPEAVTGLINLRGQIVTAIDLRTRLGLPTRELDREPTNVVIRSRGEVVSLLVDQIDDVIDVAMARGRHVEAPPSTLPLTVRRVLRGVVPLPRSILLVLDAALAADLPTPQLTGGKS